MENNQDVVTTPVATPKETVTVTSSTEDVVPDNGAAEAESETAQQDKPQAETQEQQKKSRSEKRKAEKERLIRENAAKDEQLRLVQAELAKYTQPTKPEAKPKDFSKEPDITQYRSEDYLKYVEDLADYRANLRVNQVLTEKEQKAAEAEKQKRIESFNEQINDVRATTPDFDQKIDIFHKAGLIPPVIEDAVLSSPMSGKLAEHLVNFPGDLKTLNTLRPEVIPQAIKQIEAFIKQGGKTALEEKPKVTQAAPPLKPPGNPQGSATKSLTNMTQEELEAMPQSEFNKKFYNNRRY